MKFRLALATVLLASGAPALAATPLDGYEALTRYNLITLGNLNSTSHVDGRTFVGGNLSGNGVVFNMQATSGTALTVAGNITATSSTVNNAGGVNVGGSITSPFNLNGAQTVNAGGTANIMNAQNGHTVNQNLGVGFTATIQAEQATIAGGTTALSQALTALVATETVGGTANSAIFAISDLADPVHVFSLTTAMLNGYQQISFTNSGTTIVNVIGAGADIINFNANFTGNQNGLEDVIWNFSGIATINLNRTFRGTILAPGSVGVLNSSNIDGSAVFASLTQTGEVHLPNYGGDNPITITPVPETATWAMLIAGFGLVGAAIRRRRGSGAAFA